MGKSEDDEPRFSFAKLAGAEINKKWARKMRYSLESEGHSDNTFSDKESADQS